MGTQELAYGLTLMGPGSLPFNFSSFNPIFGQYSHRRIIAVAESVPAGCEPKEPRTIGLEALYGIYRNYSSFLASISFL